MGKKGGRRNKRQDVEYNSDDDVHMRDVDRPDAREKDYYYDEIDEFNTNKQKILLDQGVKYADSDEESEEGVLGVGGGMDSSDEDVEIAEYERRLRAMNMSKFKEERASDLSEPEHEEEEIEDRGKAWGTKRSKFYGADFVDDRKIEFSGSGSDDAQVLEAQEAAVMERRLAETLDDADFDLDIFQKPATAGSAPEGAEGRAAEVVVSRDVSGLSRREKLQLLEQEAPELQTLMQDLREKLTEVHTRLEPIQKCIRRGTLQKSKGTDYVSTRLTLLLNYCTNLSFYLMLKAKRTPVANHPVIKRLLQYRNLLNQLAPVAEAMSSEIDTMLEKIRNDQPLNSTQSDLSKPYLRKKKDQAAKSSQPAAETQAQKKLSQLLDGDSQGSHDSDVSKHSDVAKRTEKNVASSKESKAARKRALADGRYETPEERQALEYFEMMRSGVSKRPRTTDEGEEGAATRKAQEEERQEMGGDSGEDGGSHDGSGQEEIGKRAITYQMAANKGLMPSRKKAQRNPRVRNKMRFKKALKQRKGQVREPRTEMTRYSGEMSGIRAGVKKSTKFKC